MVNVYEIIRNEHELPELLSIQQLNYNAIGNRQDAALILKKEFHIDQLNREHVYLVGFNENWIVSIFLVSIGTTTTSSIYIKQVATALLLSGANYFCMFHNHPCQIITPSEDDVELAMDLTNLAQLLEIEFLGSYIVTKLGYGDTNVNNQTIVKWEDVL